MRVLHMTPELPYATGGGGRGREYFMCRRLVESGHEVLNISPVLPDEVHWAEALREVGVENWVGVRPASHLREAAEATLREPAILGTAAFAPVRALEMRIFWIRLRALTERAVQEWRPDILVVGHDMAAGWARAVPETIPAVLTLHNLNWHVYLSRARLASRLLQLRLRAEAARYRRYVLALLDRFDAAVAVSTLEAEELGRIADTPVHVIPTGVDTQACQPAPEPAGPPLLLFAGTLGYLPNAQGIAWFAREVWPRVRAQRPDARLEVVGRDPPAGVRALSERDGITVVGPVPEMAPHYARAHVAIVPILTGAGIRVKIVEAMANGRAIVSTTLGWEGLRGVQPGQHLLAADSPDDFAAATLRLLEDSELRGRLARDARRLAEQRYDWRGLGDEQEAVLADVLAGRASGARAQTSAASRH